MREKGRKKKTTDNEIAKLLGVTRLTVFRWRHGMTEPSPLAKKMLKMKGVKI